METVLSFLPIGRKLIKFFTDDEITLPVQINGKRRTEITVPQDTDLVEIEKITLRCEAVVKALNGNTPKNNCSARTNCKCCCLINKIIFCFTICRIHS